MALDQFLLDERPGGPDEGWPKWCEDRANKSACVIIAGSPGWFAAYEKQESSGSGSGVATEADNFRQEFWDQKGNNARIRLSFEALAPDLGISHRLAEQDPSDARWQRDLALTHLGLARLKLDAENRGSALEYYEESLRVYTDLHSGTAGNSGSLEEKETVELELAGCRSR